MSLGQELAPHLPFLRRYARALTGSQTHGDAFVRAALEAIVASPGDFPRNVEPRLGLYRTFHAIWSTANIETGDDNDNDGGFGGAEGIAQARLSRITPLSRQALLLTSLEGLSTEDTAYLIDAEPADVDSLVAEALAEIERRLCGVMIIEDEPIIAMDIERSPPWHMSGVAVTDRKRWRRRSVRQLVWRTSSWPRCFRAGSKRREFWPNSRCGDFITAFTERL